MTKEEIQKNSEHWYNLYKQTKKQLEEVKANADYQIEGRDVKIMELTVENAGLKEENRQLKNEVEDLRSYCNQIGKVKTDVLKAFEHIVAR